MTMSANPHDEPEWLQVVGVLGAAPGPTADRRTGQPGGACGWLVVIARPSSSLKSGVVGGAARANVVVVEELVVPGAEQDEVGQLGLAGVLVRDDVVGLEFAGGGAAWVLAVG